MTMKQKLFVVGFLLVVASGFFFSHFWSYTIYVVQKTVALGILALLVFSRLLAGIAGIHLLA
jgi:hypothetical protein